MFTFQVAIVDEDPSYRWSLRTALQSSLGVSSDLEAGTGYEALKLAEHMRPDLFLISRQLPGLNGLQIGAAIQHHFPQSHVLMLMPNGADEQCLAAARIGAAAILPRFTDHETLRATVRSVLHGENHLKSWMSAQDQSLTQTQDLSHRADILLAPLTMRELAVFDCLLIGHSTKETAATLRIADQTVKNRISSILHKLDLESRMAAVRLALTNGWVEYGTGQLNPNALQSLGKFGQKAHPTAASASDRQHRESEHRVPVSLLPMTLDQLSWGQ